MEIDKKINTPLGEVHFKGTMSQEEFDHVFEIGLLVLLSRGQIQTTIITTEEDLLDDKGPQDGDSIQ